jgi:serine/threonine protein kinase
LIVNNLNSNNLYHRDLKPENFLIKTETNGKLYLHISDFGTAKNTDPDYERDNTTIGHIQGTIEYLAPEILNAKNERPDISKQDVWSIGVIAYLLCTLKLPFLGEYSGTTMYLITNDSFLPIEHEQYSDELKELIYRLLNKDPEQRPAI